MADTAKLQDTIAKIFSEKLLIEVSEPDVDLIEAGLLDSLMFVNLLVHLERDLEVIVTLETLDLDHFRSINRIVAFVAAAEQEAGTARAEPTSTPARSLAAGVTERPLIP